ncbi:hypothetical protein Q8F54_08425 [Leuconostoc mesenteroides]|uniref:hypothetical protein n=1 Tax=Leuconostoc mesenteroides TaxID=1245 RepID=UPI000C9A93BA|nr:hypothetical protein [Leuconostoc mesenteroides]KAA8366316.1 helix-turn-helix domain-containing protein [Leuconostoc mesenteroides]MCM6836130.1 helix-turn-helix domain-containing protein [Leuconostoc mesenteroides]MCT3052263.1 hypothetical protein [Leuconostoc mesenteroides]PND41319.1 hypothetical protein B0W51_06005 [Leuconostoc mesenteroides]RDG14188.1 hypothetical protein DQM12_07315 [Leuconostoc mesenteroides subsp. mesenteroides]
MVTQLLAKLDEIIKFFHKSQLPEIMDKTELAQFLGVGINNVNKYIYSDGFPYIEQPNMKDGYPKKAVQEWIDQHTKFYGR